MEIVTVLTDKEVKIINLLKSRKVFDQKNCQITLQFDSEGELKTIERKDYLYNSRYQMS
tara:strand:+ start:782 stop:958 length:177 start_codon:yes stop_codon:yes gene_type:complete